MLDELDSVEVPLAEAEQLALRTKSPENIAGCYEVRGRYFIALKKIDSAEIYLSNARKIIEDQEKEIAELQTWLLQNKGH